MDRNSRRHDHSASTPPWILHTLNALLLAVLLLGLSACGGYDPTAGGDDDQATRTPATGDDDVTTGDDDATGGDDDVTSGDDDLSSPTPVEPTITPTPCPNRDGDPACDPEDCDDGDALVYPGATELCDGKDDDCDGAIPAQEIDSDGDGQSSCGGDCAEGDPSVYTGAAEQMNCLDDNCDGTVPSKETVDADGDKVSACDDCNDQDKANSPNNTETCDGKDNNCDDLLYPGEEDFDQDGAYTCSAKPDCNDNDPAVYPNATEVCDGVDNNCDGVNYTGESDADDDGYLSCSTARYDCDDEDADIHLDALEVCDDADNDCDGATDEGFDQDNDGARTCDTSASAADCDDADAATHPGATETCDGQDNNCDGVVPGSETTDADGDGFVACSAADCNDSDAAVNPGALEICNGIDDDCDGSKDEGFEDGTGDTDDDNVLDCQDDCPRWVQADAAAGGTGSYADPFTSIQDAIDAYATGDSGTCSYITVRPGTYYENVDFRGESLTVQASVAYEAIIDGQGLGPAVSFISGEDSSTSLSGFAIEHGNGDVYPEGGMPCGGGVRIWESAPSLSQNRIADNEAELGAGMCVLGSGLTPKIEYNTIQDNVATQSGGGVYLGDDTAAYLSYNTIQSNQTSAGDGAGVYCDAMSNTGRLNNNTIADNLAAEQGGGIYASPGCFVSFQSNTLDGNDADYGGGIALHPPDDTTVSFAGGTISSCTATSGGGGLYIDASSAGGVSLSNYVISGCHAANGGGILVDYGAPLDLSSVTLTSNIADTNGGGVYVAQNTRVKISSGEISSNRAQNGAGLYVDGAYVLVIGNVSSNALALENNIASQKGGAMYLNNVSSSVNTSNAVSLNLMTYNEAQSGGAVDANNSTITFLSNQIKYNTVSGTGGGVLCEGSNRMRVTGNTIVQNVPDQQYGCQ